VSCPHGDDPHEGDLGRIVETGTPEEIFDHPRQERTRRFLDKILV
jgi:polar amino acid transport system ATP-binding protein